MDIQRLNKITAHLARIPVSELETLNGNTGLFIQNQELSSEKWDMLDDKWRNYFFERVAAIMYISRRPTGDWYMRLRTDGQDWVQAESYSLSHVQLKCINAYVERYHATAT